MFRELWEIIKDFIRQVLRSRLFPVTILFGILFFVLIVRLFTLQILEADEHQQDYVQMSLTEVSTDAVRGNIYDCNGVVLAYDQLVYSVTLKDIGFYEKSADKNQMIYELIHLLDECGETTVLSLPLGMDESNPNQTYCYTTSSQTRLRQFLRDIYGCKLDDLDREDGKYPSTITADEAMEILRKKYLFDKWLITDKETRTISDFDALRVVNIRYALSQNVYKKYLSVKVATGIKETTMATVKENARYFKGVDVGEDYVRVYPDGEYFAQIIGYTGVGNSDEIAELQAVNSRYEYGDVIGRSGIEALMETNLCGEKGSRTMYLDSTGKVLEILEEDEAIIGHDVYLTIDHDLTIACYKLLEQEMARILLTYLVPQDESELEENEKLEIPVKRAYFQLFNNNVLSIPQLTREDAPWWEKDIVGKMDSERNNVLSLLSKELSAEGGHPIVDLSEQNQKYMNYVATYLCSASGLLLMDNLDKNDPAYTALMNGSGNIRDFLYACIYAGNMIDMNALTDEQSYYDSESIYEMIKDQLLEKLLTDNSLSKLLLENLIYSNQLAPSLICMSLYSQGILEEDDAKLATLVGASDEVCFHFISDCIAKIWITPAQLALDPCNGSVVVTDVNNGKCKAVVSYPCYDNNMFSGSVNANYYSTLLNDQSNPLFNYATQARSAPGSTYKMLSGIAALESGVLDENTTVNCTGIFDLVKPAAKCWIFREQGIGHETQNMKQALANSCNYYFYNVGYLLSLEEDGSYNEKEGLEKLSQYSKMLGLGEKSGIELGEYAPQISTEYPVASAIGQGTNNYTAVQLARYVTAIASRGNLYELTLLDHIADKEGKVVDDCRKPSRHIDEISDHTWDIIMQGMYEVTHSGTVRNYFTESNISVSGKTGTAQEDLTRPSHAWFVSFGPSEKPEITVTCSIRNGYSSGYTAALANDIYDYYFGLMTLDEIKNATINQDNHSVVGD